MIQAYSDGVTVAANGTYPLNNVVFLKGNTAIAAGAGGVCGAVRDAGQNRRIYA